MPTPLALGLDSLVAAAALAPFVSSAGRLRLVLALALLDGAASYAGVALGTRIAAEPWPLAAPLGFLAAAALVFRLRRSGRVAGDLPVVAIAALLSLDNLVYRAGSVGMPIGAGLASGLASALMATAGLAIGLVVARGAGRAAPGIAVATLAVAMAVAPLL